MLNHLLNFAYSYSYDYGYNYNYNGSLFTNH